MNTKYLAITALSLLVASHLGAQTSGDLPCGARYIIFENSDMAGYADMAILTGRGPLRFSDVKVGDQHQMDSLLLKVYDVMSDDMQSSTIIISGDVSGTKLSDMLYGLSLTLPSRTSMETKDSHAPEAIPEGKRPRMSRGLIMLTLPSPRVPDEMMTSQRAISMSIFSDEFCDAAQRRIKKTFRDSGIPLDGVTVRHTGRTSEKESFIIVLRCKEQERELSEALLGSIISTLAQNGFTEQELDIARTLGLSKAHHKSQRNYSNAENINSSLRFLLFGTPFYNNRQYYDRYVSKGPVSENEIALMSKFLKVLLAQQNLTQDTLAAPVFTPDSILVRLEQAPVRMVRETSDKSLGGRLWRFSNSMTVSFSSLKGTEEFSYAVVLPPSNLILGDDFQDALSSRGIIMNVSNESGRTILRGYAPSGALEDLMSSLRYLQKEGDVKTMYKADVVLCGDLDETKTRKYLQSILGNFETVNTGAVIRPEVYNIPSKDIAYVEDNHTASSFAVRYFSNVPYTAKSYYALSVLAYMLTDNLAKSLSYIRWTADIEPIIITRPSEMFCLSISCKPTWTMRRSDQMARTADRLVLEAFDSIFSDFDLDAFDRSKALLKYSRNFSRTKADGVVEDALIRLFDGKDISSQADSIIDSITPQDVMDVLAGIYSNPTVKYIEQ